jgi:hypothetical protein
MATVFTFATTGTLIFWGLRISVKRIRADSGTAAARGW